MSLNYLPMFDGTDVLRNLFAENRLNCRAEGHPSCKVGVNDALG